MAKLADSLFLSPSEARLASGVSVGVLKSWVLSGKVEGFFTPGGGHLRVNRKSLGAYLNQLERAARRKPEGSGGTGKYEMRLGR